ncbi:MAG: RNA polymerase sigma factor [Chloroflexi bacterium]|nr:RNA polymerase sigma factor [Chloroflexota bacterium]
MASNGSDESLAKQAQQGDREAFLALYERYIDKVYNRVRSRIPTQYVEDVTQEVFIAVVRSLPSFELRSRFNTWLYTIVSRQIADFYRQQSRYSDDAPVSLDDAENLAVDLSSFNDDEIQLKKVLNDLPEHYQEVILLRFADGLSFAEIAEHRNQSLEAVKSLYRRAIQAVRDKIGEM